MGKLYNIKVGLCESCKHLDCWSEDPSPAGISLGAGWINYAECNHPDCIEDMVEDIETCGQDEEHQCPFWELKRLHYCKVHNCWTDGECEECIAEMELEMKQQL